MIFLKSEDLFIFLLRQYSAVWCVAVAMAIWGATKLSLQTWKRFQENPTVVSMERNYKEWNTSFPSVAVCPHSKYTEETLQNTVNNAMFSYVKDKKGFKQFLIELSNVTYGHFDELSFDFKELNPRHYLKAVILSKYPFVYRVSNSNPEHYNVLDLNNFVSELGICYSYNSDSTYYNDPSYWDTNSWYNLGHFPVFQSSPLDGDIFAQLRNMNSGYQMFIYGPSEFPDIALTKLESYNKSYKTLDLTALSIVSSEAAEKLKIQQRKCRLQHESNLLTSPVYSYNLCRMECRIRECFKLCNCMPYFYRPVGQYPICGFNGMQCLQKHTERLTKLLDPATGKKLRCPCLPLCHDVNYFIDTDNTMTWSLGTNLKLGLIKYPRFRLKREVLFGQTDLLVSIGGSAGLFLGCSLLSFAEILYFFTIRNLLFWRRGMKLGTN
ncbi:unnamed protein product [Nezara viridula]|uniref:Uncharacterized protein n=1 Tax=Nezara viridula TaxID=85310 RepID=A0A9P0H5V4_NEZVI|nr:unnamed protein product [Nezara viridula]